MKMSFEEQLLRRLLEESDAWRRVRPKWLEPFVTMGWWLAALVLFVGYFHYGGSSHWTALMLGIVCLGWGFYFSHQYYKRIYLIQWPIVSVYLDRTRIEERLRCIEKERE